MAAGVVPLAHNSGGPKSDIVIKFDGGETGYLAATAQKYAESLFSIFCMHTGLNVVNRGCLAGWEWSVQFGLIPTWSHFFPRICICVCVCVWLCSVIRKEWSTSWDENSSAETRRCILRRSLPTWFCSVYGTRSRIVLPNQVELIRVHFAQRVWHVVSSIKIKIDFPLLRQPS